MSFDFKSLKNNIWFFVITIAAIVILSTLSIIFRSNDNISYEEVDLVSGEINYDKLVINEIMISNNGTLVDSEGKLYDYVEIYNGTKKDINLKNYGLSDKGNTIKWVFPEVTIVSGEYLIVFLCGDNKDGLYANFKLASVGGETLALSKPNGKVIDAITTIPIAKNTVMARNINGVWEVQKDPTPGYANTKEGHNAFIKSLLSDEKSNLVINEILPSNKGNFKDNLGLYSGYVEILNAGSKTINLGGYSISNSDSINYKWQFPSISLKSGEVVLVYTSNRDIKEGTLHASFKLTNEVGVVVLANPLGEVIDKVEYENVPNGKAYIKEEKGYETSSIISPGYVNTNTGINKYNDTIKTSSSLIINEAMNSNYAYLAQNGGEYYDWIEIKNNSKETIKLSDYYLTTNTDNITRYQLPNVELQSGAYYVIMASGDTNLSNSSYKHANFKLGETEAVYLVKDGKVIDSMFISDVPTGYSIGRGDKSGIYYYSTPTPKIKNGSGIRGIAYVPLIKTDAGVYNNVKNVSVEINGQGTIYYTLDGSKPTKSSKVYKSPILLTKTTVVRAISVESGKKTSDIATSSYIINENHTLPVMSLSLNSNSFSYINSNVWVSGREVEAYAEYFEDGKAGFEIGIGLQLFGGQSRAYPKKSYEIKFKKKYGDGELHYQVFDNRDYSTYQSLVLRTGSQDEFSNFSRKILVKDVLASSIVDKYTNITNRAYKYVILYINGNYWGIYAIREKIDENFIKNIYNVSSTNTDIVGISGSAKYGSTKQYNKLLSYIGNHSMKNDVYYNVVKEQINIENFIDFWIAEQWIDNVDMFNVQYFSNPDINNGKWEPIFYDLDRSFFSYPRNTFTFTTASGGMGNGTGNYYSTLLLRSLLQNKEFRLTYIARLSYNMKNVWTEENVTNELNAIISQIEGELPRNFKKWGNNMTTWKSQVNYVKTFIKNRNKYMAKNAKNYFGLTSTQVKDYFGG